MAKTKMTLESVLTQLVQIEKDLKKAKGKTFKSLTYRKHGLKYRARKAGLKIPKDISKKIQQPLLPYFSKIDKVPQMIDLLVEKIMTRVTDELTKTLVSEALAAIKKQA